MKYGYARVSTTTQDLNSQIKNLIDSGVSKNNISKISLQEQQPIDLILMN